jgi:hypothetical protein
MSTRIPYSATTPTGQQVAEFIDAVNDALARGRRLKAQLDSMVSGEASPYPSLEAEVGGMTAGHGDDLWGIVSNAVSQIDSAEIAELARLDQG